MTRDLDTEALAALSRLREQYPDETVSDEVWLHSIRRWMGAR